MTDREKKNQIADILLDFYDEYNSSVINRSMIPNIYAGKILDSLQEEPVSEELEKASIIHSEIVRNTSVIDEDFIAGAQWQKQQDKQPINNDLEEAAKNHTAERHKTTR